MILLRNLFLFGVILLALVACKPKSGSSAATTPPASTVVIQLQSPATNPGNSATPTIAFSGLKNATSVNLYSDSSCASSLGAATVSNSAAAITTTPLNLGTVTFYYKTIPATGTASLCLNSSLSYSYAYVINATFTYDFVPASSLKLDYANKTQNPLRNVYVEMKKRSDGSVVQSFNTDDTGKITAYLYSNETVYFDISAEMKSPSVIIQDNVSGKVKYVTGSNDYNISGDTNISINLPSGWTGTNAAGSYTGARVAAPYAILDSIYSAIKKFKAVRPNAVFPALKVNWSKENIAVSGDTTIGQIGTSYYDPDLNELFILGKEDDDTDEYDNHVIVHEWGHYFEANLSRSDSMGGSHSSGEKKDMSLAFGEGWGNALSAIVFDPDYYYVDTSGARQQTGFFLNMKNSTDTNPGWYSEASVQMLLYGFYDNASTANDTVALGLGPIYDVMVGAQKNTAAQTSIFSFVYYLKANNPTSASKIDTFVTSKNISAVADAYGSGETHDGGFANNLPLYNSLTIGGAAVATKFKGYTDGNSVSIDNYASNIKYYKFRATSASTRISVSSTDTFIIEVFSQGNYLGGQSRQRTSSGSFGPYNFNLPTTAGKDYIIKFSTAKSYLFYQDATNTSLSVSVTAL